MKKLVAVIVGLGAMMALMAGPAAANPQEKVTLCHAAGLEGTTTFVTLTISYNAAFGQAGHFFENGTPRAGHEQDYLGPCNPPPPVEVRAGVTAVQPTCDNQGIASLIFERLDAIDYDVEGTIAPGETVSVTAHSLLGFLLLGQTEFEFTFDTFDSASCTPGPDNVRAAVSVNQPTCDNDGDFSFNFANTAKVNYELSTDDVPSDLNAPVDVTVTATAKEGYVLVGQSVFEVTINGFNARACFDPPPPCGSGGCLPDPPDECVAGETDQDGTCGELPHTGFDTRKLAGIGGLLAAMLLTSGGLLFRRRGSGI